MHNTSEISTEKFKFGFSKKCPSFLESCKKTKTVFYAHPKVYSRKMMHIIQITLTHLIFLSKFNAFHRDLELIVSISSLQEP